jgi:short-subunit dehydrogenase
VRDHDRIDVLVNNAGVGWMGRLHEMPEEKVDELITTNLRGVIATTQAALPGMLARRSGVIINVSSVVGFRAAPYSAVYSATKHAIVGLRRAARSFGDGSGVSSTRAYSRLSSSIPRRCRLAGILGGLVANLIVRTARASLVMM